MNDKIFRVSDTKNYEDELQKFLSESPIQSTIKKMCEDITKRKDEAMALEFAKVICGILEKNKVKILLRQQSEFEEISEDENSIKVLVKYNIIYDGMDFSEHDKEFVDEIKKLKSQLHRKETEINQIDEILEKLFGVTHDVVSKPDEFERILTEKLKGNVGSEGYCDKQKKTNNFYVMYANSAKDLTKDDLLIFLGVLTKELVENGIDFRYEMKDEMKVYDITVKDNKTLSDFLPEEPIKVADMLINAEGEYEHNPIAKAFCGTNKGTYNLFDISELRQIAEHLLVYCNANESEEE